MKHQTRKPLFRNCPKKNSFDNILCSDCRRCVLYNDCINLKTYRIQKRNLAKKQNRIRLAFLVIVIAVFVLVLYIPLNTNAQVSIPNVEKQNDTENSIQEDDITYFIVEPLELKKVGSSEHTVLEENIENTSLTTENEIVSENFGIEETIENEVKSENLNETDLYEDMPRISAYGPGTVYFYNISPESKMYIKKLLYKEVRGEEYEGMVAVAAVVLNRSVSNDPRFNTESIYSVITQKGAFAPIDDVTENMVESIPDLDKAVEDACLGWDPTRKMFKNGALFFYAPKLVTGHQKKIREGITVLEIGNHNFHNDFNELAK